MSKAEDFVKKVLASVPLSVPSILEEDTKPIPNDRIKIGDFYSIEGEPYLLAQPTAHVCTLLGLHGGNRWNEGITVIDVNNITPDEFSRIAPVGRYEVLKINIE